MLRVLVACEFSYRVTNEFRKLGVDAYSCDLEDTEGDQTYHIKDDVINHLGDGWDCMVAFPPCTHLAASGARYWKQKRQLGLQQSALDFVLTLYNSQIPHVLIENPYGYLSTGWRKPDQYVHPYYFGGNKQKKTGLWLKNLKPLQPLTTDKPVEVWTVSQTSSRAKKERNRLCPYFAKAIATQVTTQLT